MGVTADLAGWTPIRVSWHGDESRVDWCYTDGVRFDDPFFDQSVERCLRHPFRLLFRRETSLDELAAWVGARPARTPDGFVFHLSRCGSTLLAQMFAARPDTRVVSEAGPVDAVLRAPAPAGQRRDWLRAMVTALGRPATPDERHYVVKFDAWSALDLPLVTSAFPDVPWVFVYRDPVEVLVSQAGHRGYHMLPGMLPPERLGLSPADVALMSLHEYGAAVLGAICAAALGAATTDHALLVEYGELPGAVDRVAAHFGIAVEDADRATMTAVAARHAKNPVLDFTDDRDAKQRAASDEIRNASRTWADPWYRKLGEHRAGRL